MGKMLFTVLLLLGCVTTGMAQEGEYRIEGNLPPSVNEQLVLVAETERGVLELGGIVVENGYFKFTGKMPELTVVHLMPVKKNAVLATLMLENANYSIVIGENGWVVEGGGEDQKIWNEFHELNQSLTRRQKELEARLQKATSQMQAQGLQKEFQKVITEVEVKEGELLEKHGNSIVAAYIVVTRMQGMDDTKLSERFNLLGEKAKATSYGKVIAAELEKWQTVAVGKVAPDFSAPLSDGGVLALHEAKGKVKIVDFWASWCRPCRAENVNLLSIYKRYRPRGLEIISVSLDDNKEVWLKAIGQDGCYWKCVSELKGQRSEIAAKYLVKSLPCTFILDEENRIVAKNLRGKELEKKIAEMLKKKK